MKTKQKYKKSKAYIDLVAFRKQFNFKSSGLINPAKTSFDTDVIEPWAQWQNNLDADILVVGQEFSDYETYIQTKGKVEITPNVYQYPSNKNLKEYIGKLGYEIGHLTSPNRDNPIFLTNAVMGLKKPPMSSNFKTSWLK